MRIVINKNKLMKRDIRLRLKSEKYLFIFYIERGKIEIVVFKLWYLFRYKLHTIRVKPLFKTNVVKMFSLEIFMIFKTVDGFFSKIYLSYMQFLNFGLYFHFKKTVKIILGRYYIGFELKY